MGRYCSYLLPKQAEGTSQIQVNKTQVREEMVHPVLLSSLPAAQHIGLGGCVLLWAKNVQIMNFGDLVFVFMSILFNCPQIPNRGLGTCYHDVLNNL